MTPIHSARMALDALDDATWQTVDEIADCDDAATIAALCERLAFLDVGHALVTDLATNNSSII